MPTFIRNIFAVALILFLSSCLRYTPSRSELLETEEGKRELAKYAGEETFYAFEKEQTQKLAELIAQRNLNNPVGSNPTYRVGVDDELEFNVFEVPELNQKVRVRPSGFVSLPLIGAVEVLNKTEEEIQNEVTTRLDKYMHSPQVRVFISEYGARKVWVVGQIHRPGAYSLKRNNYSLIELISEAGGRTDKAGGTIRLIPDSAGSSQLAVDPQSTDLSQLATSKQPLPQQVGIEIPFDELVGSLNNAPLFIPLKQGDTIVIPEAGTIQIDGEVNKPGSFPLTSRMTLLGGIASAGGLTYSANVKEVEVIRELSAGQKSLITVDLEQIALRDGNDIRLRDGDILRVPSSPGRFATRQTLNAINGFLGRFIPSPTY